MCRRNEVRSEERTSPIDDEDDEDERRTVDKKVDHNRRGIETQLCSMISSTKLSECWHIDDDIVLYDHRYAFAQSPIVKFRPAAPLTSTRLLVLECDSRNVDLLKDRKTLAATIRAIGIRLETNHRHDDDIVNDEVDKQQENKTNLVLRRNEDSDDNVAFEFPSIDQSVGENDEDQPFPYGYFVSLT